MLKNSFLLLLFIWVSSGLPALAQPVLQNDYSYAMEVPSVQAMAASEAHLYILSDTEGMAVFRTRADSLQWLYTAGGMQQRGNTLSADIRFAYLYGDSRRLTVLEPTSVMGAYSATNLPAQPLDSERLDETLYLILGSGRPGYLDLSTPESLDSPIEMMANEAFGENRFIDIEAAAGRLFLLSDNAELFVLNKNGNALNVDRQHSLGENISRIFFLNSMLLASNNDGVIYEVGDTGTLSELGAIGEPVIDIKMWGDWLIIKGTSSRLWTSYQLREPSLWKNNRDAGNFLAISKETIWIAEYGRITRIQEVANSSGTTPGLTDSSQPEASLELRPIDDLIIPYPKELLIPLRLENDYPADQVQFSLQANAEGAFIHGQSLYWRPGSGDVGEHQFKVIASTPGGQSSSTSFTVDVRSFNAPPRFTPMRPISIPVNEPFSLPVKATDPDGTDRDLIRYLGVNLPQGAELNEQTGTFSWTPPERAIGENRFRVIATDQYGAAASVDVIIRVIDTQTGN